MEAAGSGKLDPLREHAARKERNGSVLLLSGVNGFGPSTAGAAWEF